MRKIFSDLLGVFVMYLIRLSSSQAQSVQVDVHEVSSREDNNYMWTIWMGFGILMAALTCIIVAMFGCMSPARPQHMSKVVVRENVR